MKRFNLLAPKQPRAKVELDPTFLWALGGIIKKKQ